MLPQRRRIPRELFNELLVRSEYRNSGFFTVRYKKVGAEARFGVSVSKKVSRSAVIRNRTRRRVYAALRSHLHDLPAGAYLFVAKIGAERLQGEDLRAELEPLIKGISR
ncbi:MAG: Ribonuclease protein component [Parcubacteria group bacterium]|nr:Ribonuclease protein component [Parcubacteria group bacterium]